MARNSLLLSAPGLGATPGACLCICPLPCPPCHPTPPHLLLQYLHAGTWAALSWPARGWLLCGFGAFPLASLALLKARPAAYRRHACKLSCLHHLVLAVAHQLMDIAAALQLGLPALDSSTAAAATAAWLAILSVASGTNPGAMVRHRGRVAPPLLSGCLLPLRAGLGQSMHACVCTPCRQMSIGRAADT